MRKISIVTVCLNSEKTIRDTIESVIHQNYSNLQYIIVDGLSSDQTLNIINEYRDKISVVISEKDKGISDAFNKGILQADGEVIGIINSDDKLAEGCLRKIDKWLENDTDVLYGNMVGFGDDIQASIYKPGIPKDLKKRMVLFHPSTFIRKTAYEKYGLYSLNFRYCMDRELLLRMYTKGAKFQYINETLSNYRTGGVSDSRYLTGTIPEGAHISKMYGRNSLLVMFDTWTRITKYKISQFLRNNVIGKRVRSIYHGRSV